MYTELLPDLMGREEYIRRLKEREEKMIFKLDCCNLKGKKE